jgi:hypothetical protein
MAIKLANCTGQNSVFYTGTPNYVDVDNTFTASTGLVTFAIKAADTTQPGGAWADGDTVGVRVWKDDSNFQIWKAIWVAASEYLQVETLEDSVGTLDNLDDVVVTAVLTAEQLSDLILEPQVVVISGTTHTTLDADCGKLHRTTHGSAVTITLGSNNRINWHGLFRQDGAGLMSFARASTDTINGGTTNVAAAGQFKTAYVHQITEGAWVATV